jgi:hypothetical protein
MRPFESPDLQGPGFLFPYAEVGEDVAEDVVGMDGARDFPEMVKCQPRIHGD